MNYPILTRHPVLKPSCSIEIPSKSKVVISNGNRRLAIESKGKWDDEAKVELSKLGEKDPEAHLSLLLDILSGDDPSLKSPLQYELTQKGVIIEHPEVPVTDYDGEYLAYRLIDTYREAATAVWQKNPIFSALYRPGNSQMAIGFFLETLFHVRAANITAAPVLQHSMTKKQRELLENFFVDEMHHSKGLARSFTHLGLEPEVVQRAICAPETELMERFFYSCAAKGVADFAVALIVPEIDELPRQPGQKPTVVDRLGEIHGLPSALIDSFRRHHDENDELGHESFPVVLLKECGRFTPERARELFETLHFAIRAYDNFLRGIFLRYQAPGSAMALQEKPYGRY